MSNCNFYLEPDRISMMAGEVLDRFTAHRDRRLKNVFINRFGKRREERHSCSRDVLKFLRDAYRAMRTAQAYAECLENGLICEMNAEDLQQQLMEVKAELRKENLSLRRAEVEVDEEPEEAEYHEQSNGVWTSDSEDASREVLERLNHGYREPKGTKGHRCKTCLSYRAQFGRCDHIEGWISPNGVCRCWTDPNSSLCRTCRHAGVFDGRMTKCRLDERCLRYTRICENYVTNCDIKGDASR